MANRTLLCVEPDASQVAAIRDALGPLGFDVKNIDHGDKAIEWGQKNAPALMMVSVEPRKVGYAICNKIKRSPQLRHVPLILMSSEETPQTFEQHKKLKVRADEYLLKPFKNKDLVNKVSQVLGPADAQPVSSGEILLATDIAEISEEISLGEIDIVEHADAGVPAVVRAVTPPPHPDLDAIFDQETDAAFAALQVADVTSPISTGGESAKAAAFSPWSADEWSAEETRATNKVPAQDGGGGVGAAKLGVRISELEAERTRLATEVEDLRTRMHSQPFAKEKDLLGLREIINRKDKDILDLRDSLDARERQILDHKDKLREHERARRDLEEKTLEIEKTMMSASERMAALNHDKEKSNEREKGLKARLDDALVEIQKAHDEADGYKRRLASAEDRKNAEAERVRGDFEAHIHDLEEAQRAEIARVNDEHTATENRLATEHQAEIARMTGAHEIDMQMVERRGAEELDRAQAETGRMRREHEKVLASAKEELARQLAAERDAMQLAADAKEKDHKNEVQALRRRHEDELATANDRRQREVDDLEAQRVIDMQAAETRRRTELQTRDDEHEAIVAELNRRQFTEKTEMAERHRNEIGEAHTRSARAEGESAARTEELAEIRRRLAVFESDLETARAGFRDKETRLGQAQGRISELETKVAEYEDQILRAYQKLRSDEKSIEKAKRALAVALNLLDERPGSAGTPPGTTGTPNPG